ncbi:MAG TPA: MFS transporter [Acidimicrobiia bacterium]|nr:MFS transporter [Acidimicrobiia bacterium]
MPLDPGAPVPAGEAAEAPAPIGGHSPAPGTTRGLRHAFRALRHRDFALFWTGAFVSSTGMWMQNVTVPFVLNEATGSAAWVGLGGFLQFIPAMLVGPIGGVFADRFPRRRILLFTQSLSMTVAFALWVTVADGRIDPGLIVALVSVSGIASGFGIPAWQSFVAELVPRESLLNAVSLNSAQFNASRAIGFMVGGLTLQAFGPGVAFLANATSYLAVIGALILIRAGREVVAPPPEGRESARGSFASAVAYVRARPGIMLAMVTVAFVAFLGNPVILLAPVFAREEFGVSQQAYGFLAAALGIGATTGTVLLGAYGDALRRSRLTTVSIAVYGLAVTGMGLTPSYTGGLAAMFLIGLGYLVIVSALNTSIQETVDPGFRGRVMAIYGMSFTGAFPVGALLQGFLTDVIGVRPVVTAAGLLLVGYAAFLSWRPALARSLDADYLRESPGTLA